MQRVTGIGGIFFRANAPSTLGQWYKNHLGIDLVASDYGQQPWRQEAGPTVFAPFPNDTEYFGRRSQSWMINFRVSDLDAMVAQHHGLGTVFRMSPAGVLTTLVAFNGTNGVSPYAGLVQGSDGNFYGTTTGGGAVNQGTVFRITATGVLTTLVSFSGTNGVLPYGGLVQGSDGNFYGTTYFGETNTIGETGGGTVFRMTPDGELKTLAYLNAETGINPYASLVQGSDGNFYGTAIGGGASGGGTVFQITPSGTLTTLISLDCSTGFSPRASLTRSKDGNFYGTTYLHCGGGGTVFKLAPPAPRLAIRSAGSAIFVSWPSPSSGFSLQQSTNLSQNSWIASSLGTYDDGTNKTMSLSISNGGSFFRLVHP